MTRIALGIILLSVAVGCTPPTCQAQERKPKLVLSGHERGGTSLVFSPDGKTLASAGGDGTLRLWELANGKSRIIRYEAKVSLQSLTFSPDGKRLAFWSRNGLWLLELSSGRERLCYRATRNESAPLAFSHDGRTLATPVDGGVRLWEVNSGRRRGGITDQPGTVKAVAFIPDGRTLVIGSSWLQVPGVTFRDLFTGTIRAVCEGDGFQTHALAISPDGKRVAAVVDDMVRQWQTATGKECAMVLWHTGTVRPLQVSQAFAVFSPDVTLLALVEGQQIRFWDLQRVQFLALLKGSSPVLTAAFSPDSKLLATAGFGRRGDIQLWDVVALTEGKK
jgi:WD40 repeat protein